MAEVLLFEIPALIAGEAAAVSVLWHQSVDGITWDVTPVDTILIANLTIVSGKYRWASALADPAKYHQLKTQSANGQVAEHGAVVPPRSLQSVRREINNIGQPLIDSEGRPLANVKITFRLVKGGAPADVFDATSKERHSSTPTETVTNANGEFTVRLWPTSRGPAGLKYRCEVYLPRVRPYDFTLPAGDGSAVKWSSLV